MNPTPKKGATNADVGWHADFLASLAEDCIVKAACSKAGIHRSTAYAHRKAFPEFADLWDDAVDDGVDSLESEARRRAFAGSDTLLIFLLKAHRPEKFRERYDLGKAVDGNAR